MTAAVQERLDAGRREIFAKAVLLDVTATELASEYGVSTPTMCAYMRRIGAPVSKPGPRRNLPAMADAS